MRAGASGLPRLGPAWAALATYLYSQGDHLLPSQTPCSTAGDAREALAHTLTVHRMIYPDKSSMGLPLLAWTSMLKAAEPWHIPQMSI